MSTALIQEGLIQEMERTAQFARLDRLINDIEQAALINDVAGVMRASGEMQRRVNRLTQENHPSQDLTARITLFADRARQALRQSVDTLDGKRRAARRDKICMVAYTRANVAGV